MSTRRNGRAVPHTEPAPQRPASTLAAQPEPTPPTPAEPGGPVLAPDRDATAPAPVKPARVPRTRTGAAWVGLAAAALIAVAMIVFLAQNTRTTEISFLWMTASTSLAVALLIAAVGSVLITLILGTARITQLRRLARRRRS